MNHFCTLFDKNYLFQAIALHRSLQMHAAAFTLHALCMDEEAFAFLQKAKLPNLLPISLSEVENDEIREVRNRTTHGQFCWSCQPVLCEFLLNKLGVEWVTYLEADSLFFADPQILLDELHDYSSCLVPHRFSPGLEHLARDSGRYCVQFNAFRNDEAGRDVLSFWKRECFRYSKDNPDFHPGQLCLDEWQVNFMRVREIQHLGAGVAPWNVRQYKIADDRGRLLVDGSPVVFFHYHQYGRYENGTHELGHYRLSPKAVTLIYLPYIKQLDEASKWIGTIDPKFRFRKVLRSPEQERRLLTPLSLAYFKSVLAPWKRRFRGTYNIFRT